MSGDNLWKVWHPKAQQLGPSVNYAPPQQEIWWTQFHGLHDVTCVWLKKKKISTVNSLFYHKYLVLQFYYLGTIDNGFLYLLPEISGVLTSISMYLFLKYRHNYFMYTVLQPAFFFLSIFIYKDLPTFFSWPDRIPFIWSYYLTSLQLVCN